MSHGTLDNTSAWNELRQNIQRPPGLIHVQRQSGGLYPNGIPTFFRGPLAQSPADLEAGDVDVAILGCAIDSSTGMRGASRGPQALRTSDVYGGWGSFAMPHMTTMVNFAKHLVLADYGDAPTHPLDLEGSLEALSHMVESIASAHNLRGQRVIPIIVGGDHSISYGNLVAMSRVYGRRKIGVVHFDAHYDGSKELYGQPLNHSTWVYRLIEEEIIEPAHLIQVGLRGYYPGRFAFEWMKEVGIRFHTMHEIEQHGWSNVMEAVLREAGEGVDHIFITVDLDVLDPVYFPGVGTPEPGGLTTRELFPLIRRLCAERSVIGMDLAEFNPLLDPTFLSGLTANRVLCEALTGLAMHKLSLIQPDYRSPLSSTMTDFSGRTPATESSDRKVSSP